MNYELNESSQNISVDPEELKIVVGQLRKYLEDLKIAKEKADNAWDACRDSLESSVTKDIELTRDNIKSVFNSGIQKLENSVDNLDSICNIWKDTEIEIMSTSKQVEELVSKLKAGIDLINFKN